MASGQHSEFGSRDERRQALATIEAQKAGTAPPDTDEAGNAINPHIPQYMSQAPWYLGFEHKTLKHQRKEEEQAPTDLGAWYPRGKFQGPAATKYRKGACPNCGSMTHKEKDCVERPRAASAKAKYSGKDIRPDELVADVKLSWAGKRDLWNGVDLDQCQQELAERHSAVEQARKDIKANRIQEHLMQRLGITPEKLEEAERRLAPLQVSVSNCAQGRGRVEERVQQLRDKERPTEELQEKARRQADELEQALKTLLALVPSSEGGLADDDHVSGLLAEEDMEKDDVNAAAGERDGLTSKVNTGGVRDCVDANVAVRNLRIREDTAKYLRNLSTDARNHYDPKSRSLRGTPYPDKAPDEVDFAGDNWVRSTGDAVTIPKMQVFCWDATKRIQEAGHKGKYISMQANPTQAERAFKKAMEAKEDLTVRKESALLDRYGGAEHLRDRPTEIQQGATEGYTVYRQDGTVIQGEERAAVRSKYEEDVYINGHKSVWGSYWEAGQWGYQCCKCLVHNSLCTAGKAAPEPAAADAAILDEIRQLEEEMKGSVKRTEAQREEDSTRAKRRRKDGDKSASALGGSYDNGVAVTDKDLEAWREKRLRAEDPMAAFLDGGPSR
eukprot:TRINITY_DN48077_c0_g1_i1.p1 TRINITY_DN48077_c0_g1~~TRINITY_DN48077_c0_g1_i1.p1  ORF type:complete len:632 (+),score=222.99 TRINITY_DN48077_c0_g1_i1:60-1898(+)